MKTTLILILAIVLLRSSVAQACSCINPGGTEQEKIAAAYQQDALIFVGRVLRVDTVTTTDTVRVAPTPTGSGGEQVHILQHKKLQYTFAVSRKLKGEVSGRTVRVATEMQSASCGRLFRVGGRYLVHTFLVSQKESLAGGEPENIPPYYATSLCNRGQELNKTKRAELKQLRKLARTKG